MAKSSKLNNRITCICVAKNSKLAETKCQNSNFPNPNVEINLTILKKTKQNLNLPSRYVLLNYIKLHKWGENDDHFR